MLFTACSADGAGKEYTCTVTISCADILENIDKLDPAKIDLVPEDGILLEAYSVTFAEGASVFDILLAAAKENNIHMEHITSPAFNTAYIEGIGNLYEFDCGPTSGWTYTVNGESPSLGCSSYKAEDGDVIEFVYSCEKKDQF